MKKKGFSAEQFIGKLREEEEQSDDGHTEDGKKKGCYPRDFEHAVKGHHEHTSSMTNSSWAKLTIPVALRMIEKPIAMRA